MIHVKPAHSLAGGEDPWITMIKQSTKVAMAKTDSFR